MGRLRGHRCNPVAELKGEQQRVWTRAHVARDFAKKGSLQRKDTARLRVGYISSDFVNHPTADLIQSALLKHDRSKFEIFAYSITKDDDSEYRRRLSSDLEHFQTLRSSHADRRCAEIIAEQGIHILVNLNGHTAGDRNGISALRPAPVQLVYLAYPGTMGAGYIDYNVVDDQVCPPAHREHYSEKLLRMPHCYQANSFSDLYKEVLDLRKLPSRLEHQLPERPAFVFCNFCRLGRITQELFAMWMRVLKRVPGSVIWLYKHPRAAMARLQMYARQAGVDQTRLVFAPPCSPKIEHLKRVTLADLCLDTLVYNGHTTGSDMLWAGVPMVTMRGDNWPSLVATCLAHSVDMPEMVVESLAQYEERAVELALEPERLRSLRAKLCVKRLSAPLFDSERWIRSFENALEQAWDTFASSNAPQDLRAVDFGVSPSALQVLKEFGPVQPCPVAPSALDAMLCAAAPASTPAGEPRPSPCPPECAAAGVGSGETPPRAREDSLVRSPPGSPVDTAPPEGSHNPTPVDAKSVSATPDSATRHASPQHAAGAEAPASPRSSAAAATEGEGRMALGEVRQGGGGGSGASASRAGGHGSAVAEESRARPVGGQRAGSGSVEAAARPAQDSSASQQLEMHIDDLQPAATSGQAAGADGAECASAREAAADSVPAIAVTPTCCTPERRDRVLCEIAEIEREAGRSASPSPGKLFKSNAVKQLEPASTLAHTSAEQDAQRWQSSLQDLQVAAMASAQQNILQLTSPPKSEAGAAAAENLDEDAAANVQPEGCQLRFREYASDLK